MSNIPHKIFKEIEDIKKHRGYLGELILSEDELQELFKVLSKADLEDSYIIACLAVAAINCAFYYYDEEGFWKHFDKLLGNIFEQNHDYYGNKILSYLKKNYFVSAQENEFGSYKYVRPILLQSGISKKHVYRFSEFINRVIDRFGASAAITISFAEFKEVVSTIPEGNAWLRKFLASTSGWEYTKDVLRHLVAGYSKEELYIAKGFHQELWDLLIDGREILPSDRAYSKYKKPFFMFDLLKWQFGIFFDPKGVQNRVFTMNDRTITMQFVPVGIDTSLGNIYTGEMHVQGFSSSWRVEAWNPQEEKCALFHAISPHKCVRDKSAVLPGKYYLVVTEDEPVNEEDLKCMEAVDEGEIEIFTINGEIYLKVYSICLKPDTSIDNLGLKTLSRQDFKIEWVEGGQRLEGVIDDIVVWIEDMLPLKIEFSPNLVDRVAFYQDTGSGRRKIVSRLLSNGTLSIDIPFGIKGRIWAEPFGRSQIHDEMWETTEKIFCRLPKCDLRWPKGLFAYDEKPEIIFISDEPIDICWTYPDKITEMSSVEGRRWQLPEGCERVEGFLRYKELEIGLAQPIYRCRMEPVILWQDDLAERFNITLHLLPETNFSLSISGRDQGIPIIEKKTYRNGKVTLTSDDIKDALKNYHSVYGHFVVDYDAQRKNTGSIFINTDQLIEYCKTVDENMTAEWLIDLPEPIHKTFNLLSCICIGKKIPVLGETEWLDSLPVKFRDFIMWNIVASEIFDDSIFNDEYKKHLNKDLNSFIEWAKKVKKLCSNSEECNLSLYAEYFEEGQRYTGLLSELSVDRWEAMHRSWLSKLEIRSKVDKMLLEWKEELSEGTFLHWDCEISRMTGGREVTIAWYDYYLKQRPDNVCRYLNSPEVQLRIEKGNDLIKALMRIVRIFSLLRTGMFLNVSVPHSPDEPWHGALVLLENLYTLYGGNPICKEVSANPKLLFLCPLSDHDKELLSIIANVSSEALNKTEWAALARNDWLSAWVLYNLAKKNRLAIEQQLLVILKDSTIPPSDIKPVIEETLRDRRLQP